MTSDTLPSSDCHAKLRQDFFKIQMSICSTVSWNWYYLGITEQGIHDEFSYLLSLRYFKDNKINSLPIPETSLLRMPYGLIAKHKMTTENNKYDLSDVTLPFVATSSNQSKLSQRRPSPITTLSGIKNCLKLVVENHDNQYCRYVELDNTMKKKKKNWAKKKIT